jgi:hypothetical protein
MWARHAYTKDQGSFYSSKNRYLTVIQYLLTIEITEQVMILTGRKTSVTARSEWRTCHPVSSMGVQHDEATPQ